MRALLLLAVLLQDAPAPSVPAGGPRLLVQPGRLDFGRVLAPRTLNRSVQLRNAGVEDLRIEKVTSSCDCAVASDYDAVVKPGRATTLKLTLTTREAGRMSRSLVIHTNDPTRPQVELKVEATVVADPNAPGRH